MKTLGEVCSAFNIIQSRLFQVFGAIYWRYLLKSCVTRNASCSRPCVPITYANQHPLCQKHVALKLLVPRRNCFVLGARPSNVGTIGVASAATKWSYARPWWDQAQCAFAMQGCKKFSTESECQSLLRKWNGRILNCIFLECSRRWTKYSNPGQLYPPRPPNFKFVFIFQGLRQVDKRH